MMDKKLPRRDLLKGALAGLAAIAVVSEATAQAKKPVAVDPNEAQAKALGYVLDTTKVDAKANPMHKPEQHCGNCVQFKGAATDAVAPCSIFAGKTVVNKGWCKVWAKKPGT
jgi:hypothetical protein